MPRSPAAFPTTFYLVLLLTGIASFLVHELAHWLTGLVLGYEMVATLNSVTPMGSVTPRDLALIAGAGPLLTVGQGLLGFWLVWKSRSHLGFALLYIAFFMRLVAAGVSVFNPNDEAKLSQLLGLGTWTLPVLVVGGLLALVVVASRRLQLKLRDQLLCYVVASVAVTLVVGVDMALWPKG